MSDLARVEQASPMYRVTRPKTVARERTEVLERRVAFLTSRIRERRRGIHHDRAERAALQWAIGLARAEVGRLAEQAERELRRAEGGDARNVTAAVEHELQEGRGVARSLRAASTEPITLQRKEHTHEHTHTHTRD